MPNTALASLIHALFSQVVPALIIAGVACLLLRELLQWLERSMVRGFQSRRSARRHSAENLIRSLPTRSPLPSRLYRLCRSPRSLHSSSLNRQTEHVPDCPMCDAPMVKRSIRRGPRAVEQFWGCANYPMCRTTRALSK